MKYKGITDSVIPNTTKELKYIFVIFLKLTERSKNLIYNMIIISELYFL